MIQHLDPFDIAPLHGVRNTKQLKRLAADMVLNGWAGRALLVIDSAAGYIAWTGSHRIAAAREAELPTVPCFVVTEKRLAAIGADALKGHCDDADRLVIIRKLGVPDALHIMWQEGRSN